MHVLVTGAAGMIGSHIVEALLDRGDSVFSIDDLSRGKRENLPSTAELAIIDIRDAKAVAALNHVRPKFDAIVHQAAIVNEGINAEEIQVDIDVNQVGTVNLLELARDMAVPRFIYASSVAVYGRPIALPAKEDETIPEPIASYGIGKLASEHYVRYMAAAAGFEFAILRYSNIYGPRQPALGEVGAIRRFVEAAARSKPITVFGDGTQVRDYLYVADCVAGTMLALDASGSMTVNIASGTPTTVNDLVATLNMLVEGGLSVTSAPLRLGEIGQFWCDADKAGALLQWQAHTSLLDGMARTLEWEQAR